MSHEQPSIQKSPHSNTLKPRRPLGLTIAILAALLLFFILPMLEVLLILLIDNTFIVENGVSMAGINLQGIDYSAIALQIALSSTYLIVAVLTLKGIHPAMRYIFPFTTLALALMHIFLRIIPLLTTPHTFTDGFDSASAFARQYATTHLIMMILTVVYTIWFLNRWSARAFFRRHYTPDDLQTLQKLYE